MNVGECAATVEKWEMSGCINIYDEFLLIQNEDQSKWNFDFQRLTELSNSFFDAPMRRRQKIYSPLEPRRVFIIFLWKILLNRIDFR